MEDSSLLYGTTTVNGKTYWQCWTAGNYVEGWLSAGDSLGTNRGGFQIYDSDERLEYLGWNDSNVETSKNFNRLMSFDEFLTHNFGSTDCSTKRYFGNPWALYYSGVQNSVVCYDNFTSDTSYLNLTKSNTFTYDTSLMIYCTKPYPLALANEKYFPYVSNNESKNYSLAISHLGNMENQMVYDQNNGWEVDYCNPLASIDWEDLAKNGSISSFVFYYNSSTSYVTGFRMIFTFPTNIDSSISGVGPGDWLIGGPIIKMCYEYDTETRHNFVFYPYVFKNSTYNCYVYGFQLSPFWAVDFRTNINHTQNDFGETFTKPSNFLLTAKGLKSYPVMNTAALRLGWTPLVSNITTNVYHNGYVNFSGAKIELRVMFGNSNQCGCFFEGYNKRTDFDGDTDDGLISKIGLEIGEKQFFIDKSKCTWSGNSSTSFT